jgi:cation/acetate symporter
MSSAVFEQIRSNKKYPMMVAKRRRLAGRLSAIVLGIFFGFILVVAFAPALLARPLAEGAVTTVAVPLGVAMIVVFWLLTGLYMKRAERDFDQIRDEIMREVIS